MLRSNNTKNSSLNTNLFFVVLVIIVLGFIYLKLFPPKSITENNLNPTEQISTEVPGFIETVDFSETLADTQLNEGKEILVKIAQQLNSEEALRRTSYSWWKQNDATLIPLNAVSLRLLLPNQQEMSTGDDIALATSTINQIFIDNGFQVNELNTDRNNEIFYFYAYDKAGQEPYCTAVFYPASSELGSVDCGVKDLEEIEKNRPFENILFWFDGSKDNLQFSVDKIVGNAASGGISIWHAPSGAWWIATKKDGQWQQIYLGQESPPCNLVDANAVPREIYENCFEDPAGIMRFNNF